MGFFNILWKFSLVYIIVTFSFSFVLFPMVTGYKTESESDILLLFMAVVLIFSDLFVISFLINGFIMDYATTGILNFLGIKSNKNGKNGKKQPNTTSWFGGILPKKPPSTP